MAVRLLKHRFTVEEYHRMGQAGIFSEDDRVELIEGEIVEMTPVGSRHAACVRRLNDLLSQRVGRRAVVSVQDPIHLGEHSEPEPDLALLIRRPDYYAAAHPRPKDVLLVIEVAETSLEYDREVKLPLYARSGIPEAWLINLQEDRVEVYRKPTSQGYREVQRAQRGQRITVEALPDLAPTVDEILG